MSTPPATGVDVLNRARATAARFRAEWLHLVHDRMVTPGDVLAEAARPEAKPLLKLSARQLLLAQPGWGRARADAVIERIITVSQAKIESRQTTIGWLLDPRAGGRRFAAWLDAFEDREVLPEPGFPYAQRSSGV